MSVDNLQLTSLKITSLKKKTENLDNELMLVKTLGHRRKWFTRKTTYGLIANRQSHFNQE